MTGLPEPQKHHAPIMVKFAADCRSRMNVLTIELEKTLGPGTSELKLRQGLHSGSVTAGVLRNDKSRFQLFGDTVRVECGVAVCICNRRSSSFLSLSND